jgi:gamma-glutamylcyclotransferase (GGCT)/AIG2-like uncharacterized protein YtfP
MSRLFVYGTLMPGQVRWPILGRFATGSPATASVDGTLYNTGYGFPALFPEGSGTVPGIVIPLNPEQLDEALVVLDAIEGTASGLFRRAWVKLGGSGAWVYYGADPSLRGQVIERWAA